MTERRLRDDALAIWKAGVDAVEAGRLVRGALRVDDDAVVVSGAKGEEWFMLHTAKRIAIVGAGKATTAMARAAQEALGTEILAAKQVTGWVNVPDATVEKLSHIHVHGARKLPDNRPTAEGVAGSKEILAIAQSLDAGDYLIVLLSGGGSALLPLPVDGVTLEDKLAVTKLLQERGATINEMNCVRKHLSQIKGGRLAQATKANVITLIVSDVVGDPLDVIASGPTAPDPTTFAGACSVLEKHELLSRAPASVLDHLDAGCRGVFEETPDVLGQSVDNFVIGNNDSARRAAANHARVLGYQTIDLGIVDGDTQSAARGTAAAILETHGKLSARTCFIDGGETTVNLGNAPGKGGRNQEFALAVLDALGANGLAGVCVLSGGTDGEDGPTDAAGAFVDEDIARAAVAKGLDPAEFLRRHDAYNFFDPIGGLIRTGPTNTNVMDLRVVLIDRAEGAAVPALKVPEQTSASASAGP